MKINTLILLGGLSVLSLQTQATTLYQADFNSGGTASQYGLNIVFGSPNIAHMFGAANDQQLVFNSPTGGYEQVKLNWPSAPVSGGDYQISFDLMTHNLIDSQYSFTMLLDTPTIQNLDIGGYGNWISTFNPMATGPSVFGTVGHLSDDTLMHVAIDINLNQSLWTIAVNGVGQYQGAFYTSGGGINDLRFNLSPWQGGAAAAPNISVALDNLQISSVPLPGAGSLLISALAAIAINTRRQRIK